MPSEQHLIETAARLALQAHAGQIDKVGLPYILHVLRVGAAGKTWEEITVGFLHDVFEDTDMSASMLRSFFGDNIMIALAAITREPGEVYTRYIERVANNPLARTVKINDLKDNIRRSPELHTDEIEGLRRRYRKALAQLGVEEI